MSLRAIVWAFDQIRAGRVPQLAARLVLLKIADRANDDGVCWPGRGRLGEDVQLSEPTVRASTASLEAADLIAVERRKDAAGRNLSNRYHLNMGEGQAAYPRGKAANPEGQEGYGAGEAAYPESSTRTIQPESKTTTTPTDRTSGGGTLDDLVEAAVWLARQSGKKINNISGYRAAVRKRLANTPPSVDDLLALTEWHARNARAVTMADTLAATASVDLDPAHMECGRVILDSIKRRRKIREASEKAGDSAPC